MNLTLSCSSVELNINLPSTINSDKLNIEIKSNNDFLIHDLSTSGYGSDISKKFYKKSYSDNTVVIDGKDQNLECKLIIEFYNDNMINVRVNL